jgi:hypothetical protein
MAIGRITGQMLSANLARSGTDLTFETNLLALDVTNSRVGIGTASPATTLHVSATDALRLPAGSDAQRPGTPANGDIRYNSDQTTIEGYANGAWANLASGTELKDADEDTKVNVEATSDIDEIHFQTGGTYVGKIATAVTEFGVTQISNTASTITSLTTNGDITLTPNGTGEVVIPKINVASGEIDGTAIGANSASTGAFTTLSTTGNATIGGDLTVNGTTTTIDSQTLVIEDPLLTLAKNNSGGAGNTFDQGLFFNRGSDDNVSFIWDESADQFAFAITSGEDGTTAGNVTIDSYANIRLGVATASDVETATVSAADGTLSMTIADSTGNITTTADIITSDLQTSTVKANDGTAAIGIADSTGVVTVSTNLEVDGGTFTFNETGADLDARFEGDTDQNLLFIDAGADSIGIGTGTPGYSLDIGSKTDAVLLPQGNTGARPTAATGIIRFNTQTGSYEGCTDGSTYVNFATSGDAPTFTKETTTGDGSTTTFTGFFGSAPESANNVFVYIDNVYQEPTENYSVSGTNITFTSAPHSGARIFAITGADNSALVTGGVARSEASSVNFTSSATTIMSFNAATYRSAELFIQMQDTANTEYSAMKAIVTHDGTTAYITVFGITNTGSTDLGTVTATHDGSNTVNVQAVSTGGQTQAKVQYSLASI